MEEFIVRRAPITTAGLGLAQHLRKTFFERRKISWSKGYREHE